MQNDEEIFAMPELEGGQGTMQSQGGVKMRDLSPDGYASDPEYRARDTRVRNTMGDSMGTRPKSAIRKEDLRGDRLTTNDYANKTMENERVARFKKGNYNVTVPEPFDFEIRAQTKSKSIRERKIDAMVEEKKLEEENQLKHQFRAKRVPTEVKIPRYQKLLDAEDKRREEVKKNSIALTKHRDKPFSFYERDKSRKRNTEAPLPPDCQIDGFRATEIPPKVQARGLFKTL
jgi:hypothetical protein